MDVLIICLGAVLFMYRSRKIRFKNDWFERSRQCGTFSGLSVIGFGLFALLLLRDEYLVSGLPPWSHWIMLGLGVFLTAIVVFPLFLLAYMCMYHAPLRFLDLFGMWEEESYVQIFPEYPSDTAKTIIRTLWAEHRPVDFIRYQAVASVDKKVQEMRMNLGRIVVTTIPALIFSFAIISSAGQSLSFWTIMKGDRSSDVARSLVDHVYFVCSVVSTLGMGDLRPVLDSFGLGEIFVILMVTIFMLSALIVFSLLIAFAHSMLTALEGEISNTISDLSLDSPRIQNPGAP